MRSMVLPLGAGRFVAEGGFERRATIEGEGAFTLRGQTFALAANGCGAVPRAAFGSSAWQDRPLRTEATQ